MLKGIDPRLDAEVLATLRAMGHGDMLVVADANFPAASVARHTHLGRVLSMANLATPQAVQAILSLLPLDTFVADFAARMLVVDHPEEVPEVQAQIQAVVNAAEGRPRPIPGVDRFAFYDLARSAFAIIQCGERRFYGNVMLRKGVIPADP